MNKRGASLVIAWVLLLGLSISLAIGVFSWSKLKTEALTDSSVTFVEGSLECNEVKLNVKKIGECASLDVYNRGKLAVEKIGISSLDGSSSKVVDANLIPLQNKVFEYQGVKSKEGIEVLPIIRLGDELVACRDRRVLLDCLVLITIITPFEGEPVSGVKTIQADVSEEGVSVLSPSGAVVAQAINLISGEAVSEIEKVEFKIDGVVIKTVTIKPYATQWDTTKFSNGQHEITAVVTYKSGRKESSAPVKVTVENAVTQPTPPVDTTAPILSNGQPTGQLSAGTTQTTLSLTTNEQATCKYSTTANVAYSSMTNSFTTTGSTSHSTTISGLTNGITKTYYVRCKDNAGNANTNDYPIIFSVASTTTPPPVLTGVRAFPTAEGFGANTIGGRGGRVIEVTNLNDNGAGSLRACAQASGPRICVFRVGGTITLASPLGFSNPYITIAGQTAPGGGITIKGNKIGISGHDVIMRHIRIRPGPATVSPSEHSFDIVYNGDTPGQDTYNIIVDHSSISWGTDDQLAIVSARAVTFQRSIISEGLICGNIFGKPVVVPGCGSRAVLSYIKKGYTNNEVSFHHNLFAHNEQRHPAVAGDWQIVNNVIYNLKNVPAHIETTDLGNHAPTRSNFVGNYYKDGSDTMIAFQLRLGFNGAPGYPCAVHNTDNIWEKTNGLKQAIVVNNEGGCTEPSTPFSFPTLTTQSAANAYTNVLANVGATRPLQDSVDARLISDVQKRTGRIISYPSDVGGWPSLAAGTPPTDTDKDGMPNSWESSHGLNPNDVNDGARASSNGYTNLENYLNELAGDVIF